MEIWLQGIHDAPRNWSYMNRTEKLSELRNLQSRCDAIRQELGISPPGCVLYLAPVNGSPLDMVVVEADGFGGATASVVEGNFPVDYFTKFERSFFSESEAERRAGDLACHRASPDQLLTALQ
jgi:hypothetical protein